MNALPEPPIVLFPLPLGRVVATPGALAAMTEAGVAAFTLLARHQRGDWGDLCAEDHQANVWALQHGARLLSNYTLATGRRIWIISEADRSSTCLLLPEEY
jgi:hypothetical protein